MKDWLNKRRKEPTTFIGISMLVAALGTIFKADYTQEASEVIAQAAEPIASGDYTTAITLALGGIMGVFMREKGNNETN